MAVANQAKDERFPSTLSVIYRFDKIKKKFVAHQFIKTFVAQSWEYFQIEGKNFIAVTNYGVRNHEHEGRQYISNRERNLLTFFKLSDSSYREKSWVYLWEPNARVFVPYQVTIF